MEKKFISDLVDKENFRSVFFVSDKQLLQDKKGNDYLNLYLSDRTGTLNARMWDKVDLVAREFDSGDFVEIKGHSQLFQNKMQIIVHDLKKCDRESVKLEDFLAKSRFNSEEMLSQLLEQIDSLENKFVRELLQKTMKDPAIQAKILQTPAAKSIHHAFLGGLLEHVLSICKIMEFLASHYSFLNRDLLYFGAIYHDLGKVREFEIESGIQYSDEGRLVGHMTIACELIDRFASEIADFPQDLKDSLKHIVLSHHGRLEYGSPKRPKFLEAVVVAMVDELDSRVDSIKSIMESELSGGSNWTSYSHQYDRYFYLKFLREALSKPEK